MPTLQRGSFTTYYEEAGQGEPVVLICGFGAELQAWRFNLPELTRHFRVITFDNRGAGRSSAPDEPYRLEQMADDLAALFDHLRVPVASLLGWSVGGMIAQRSPSSFRPGSSVSRCCTPHWRPTPPPSARSISSSSCGDRTFPSTAPYTAASRLVYSPPTVNNAKVFEQIVQFTLENP